MKKIWMSLLTVAVLSSAAMASSGEKNSKTKTVKPAVDVKKEVIGATKGTKRYTRCRYTVTVYNSSGQVINTHVFTALANPDNPYVYSSCSEFYADTNAWLESVGYTFP